MQYHRSRRSFLQIIGASAVATAAVPAGLSQLGCNIVPQHDVTPDENLVTLDLADYPELETTGGMSIVMVDDGPTLAVVRVAETGPDAFVTLDGICTHAGCMLSGYDDQDDEVYCNCHGSSFDLDGEVSSGPAETPLVTYPTEFDEGDGTVVVDIG